MIKKYPSLHTNTEYSLLSSTIKIDSLISFAIENNLSHIVMTDRNNLFGALEFWYKATNANLKPIIGLDLDVDNFRLILIPKNLKGYENLIKLSSLKMKMQNVSLNDVDSENNFILDHPTFGMAINKIELPKWENFIQTSNNIKETKKLFLKETRMLDKGANDPLMLLKSIDAEKIQLNENDDYSYEVITEDRLSSTQIKLVEKVLAESNYELPKIVNPLPTFKNDENMDSETYLKYILNDYIKNKYKPLFAQQKYKDRLRSELEIISKLHFSDYFLIIWDLVKWAKENNIAVGPGRGSSAGSLVAFLLNITEVDPLPYDLLFERFLNVARVSMPDIDIDFQDNRRDDVINYLSNKYGNEHCALISTFSRLAAKSALRDTGRYLKIANSEINDISKQIKLNETLEIAYKDNSKFRALIDKTDISRKLYTLALSIEGLPRQHGTHAAGIVLSSNPFSTCVPTIYGPNNFNQIQFPMDNIEEYGLLKIDILGLRNLTIFQNIILDIEKNYKSGEKVEISSMPLHDKLTNELLSSGDTLGVFQLESPGMIKTLQRVGVSNLNDLASIISLFRPGPLNNIWDFANAKRSKVKLSIDPSIDGLLDETYGIIVYQEQIMKIVQVFSGMSFSEADILRRAIGKKDEKLLFSLKEKFVSGALSLNRNEETIKKVYSAIEKFASYGFNKSHAIAYSILAYRLAYLKTRFPYEFFANVLDSSRGNFEYVERYVFEIKERGLSINSVDIDFLGHNVSCDGKRISLPLTFVKEVGQSALDKIIEERNKGPFTTFINTCVRFMIAGVPTNVITNLIKAGAFKKFNRPTTLLNWYESVELYKNMATKTIDGVKVFSTDVIDEPVLPSVDSDFIIESRDERELLGTNIDFHETMKFKYKLTNNLKNINVNDYLIVRFDKVIKEGAVDKDGEIQISDFSNAIILKVSKKFWNLVEKSKQFTCYKCVISVKINLKNKQEYHLANIWEEYNE